jgi:predicted acetyltransferase
MFEYRRLQDPAEILEIATSAFAIRHPEQSAAREWLEMSVAEGRELYGVYEAGRLQAGYMIYEFDMRLRSSLVKMGGIGLLCSRLDGRGRGAVRTMLKESLKTMQEKGHAVSVLDPFDEGFYRKYGWEKFSRLKVVEFSPGVLSIPEDEDSRLTATDLSFPDEATRTFYNEYAAHHYTLAQRGVREWKRRTEILGWYADAAARGVVKFSRGEDIVGLMGYDIVRKTSEEKSTFLVNLAATEREDVFREMLRYLQRLSHQVSAIRFDLPLDMDLWPYLSDRPSSCKFRDIFMIRIVSIETLDGLRIDAPDQSVRIDVQDSEGPWNGGTWEFRIASGVLHVARSDKPDLRCSIGSLSSAISGFSTLRSLIASGRIAVLPSYASQDLPEATTFLADYF